MLKIKEPTVLIVLSVILTVFILFSASFFMVFIDRGSYDKAFDKYGVYNEIGVQGVRNTVDYLINYLTSENTEINKIKELSIFTLEEQSHLEDVRDIIIWVKALSIASLVLVIIFILRLRMLKDFNSNLKRILVYGGIATLAVVGILFLLSLDFSPFFLEFHKVFFPQGNYMFTSHHLLPNMFPEGFFYDFTKKMFFHIGILSLILIFLGTSSALTVRNTRRN